MILYNTSGVDVKALVEQSFRMGYEACPQLHSAPYLNSEFMKTIPNCEFGDDKGVKLRIKMYKAYIKGWTQAHLDKVWNVN